MKALKEIRNLEDNWDSYGAKAISEDVILEIIRFETNLEGLLGRYDETQYTPVNDGSVDVEVSFGLCGEVTFNISEDDAKVVEVAGPQRLPRWPREY